MDIETIKKLPDFRFIRSLDVFDGLSDETVLAVFSRLSKSFFKRGDYIFRQGEKVDRLYFLEMGKVEIYKYDASSKRLTLWFMERGGVFCLVNLFAPASFANALAVTDCLAFEISKEDLIEVVLENSLLVERMLCCLSRKNSVYVQLLETFAFKKVEQRLAHLLLNNLLCQGCGGPACDMTHGEIASMIGTRREVVCRLVKKFVKDGLIEVKKSGKGQSFTIRDERGLKRLSESEGFGS